MKAFLSHHSCLLQEAMSPRIEFCWTNNEDSALDRIAQSWAIWQTFSELLAILQNSLYTKNVQKRNPPQKTSKIFLESKLNLPHFFHNFLHLLGKKNSPCGLPANLHPETLSKWLFPQGWNPTDTEVGPRHPEKKSQLHGEWWTVSWIYPLQDAIVTTVHSHFSHHSTVKSIWSMCILDLHPPPRMLAGHHQKSETFWGSGITTTKLKRKSATITEWGGVDPNYISKWFVVPKIIYKGIDFLQNERFSDVCIASI